MPAPSLLFKINRYCDDPTIIVHFFLFKLTNFTEEFLFVHETEISSAVTFIEGDTRFFTAHVKSLNLISYLENE
jgi:hypothetical protein